MKRVRVAPGKYVNISAGLAEKAARIFATSTLTAEQIRQLKAIEPRCATGLMIGSPKPLTIARPGAGAKPGGASSDPKASD